MLSIYIKNKNLFALGLKYCSKCQKKLPISSFHKSKNIKNGLRAVCKKCAYKLYTLKSIHKCLLKPNFIYKKLKNNSLIRNISFTLIEKDFINWYNSQEQKCYYCGRTLEEIRKDKRELGIKYLRLSIDRKNNKEGYTANNIALCCMRCNKIKSNYFTEQEMLKIGKTLYKNE